MIVCLCAILILAYILRNRKELLAYFCGSVFFPVFFCILAILMVGIEKNRRHKFFYLCVIWEKNFNCKASKEIFLMITLDYYQIVIIFFSRFGKGIFYQCAHTVSRDSIGLHRCRAILPAYRGGLRDLRGPCPSQSRNRGPVHHGRAGGRLSRLGSTRESVEDDV